MLPLERQASILQLLRQTPGITVSELAQMLRVSEGTIRNDLKALESAGKIQRVRGGAIVPDHHTFISPTFAARARTNVRAKECIARWAAELVEDGDSIMLDASTTVYAMVPYLQKRKNLTVITNGIEIALALAKNLSHTVILIGGKVRPDGTSVGGSLGEQIVRNLHARTAFVSCTGFSVSAGLTEVDLPEIELKRLMIQSAERVIALIDSSKFGRVDLTSFATIEQIAHIFTDDQIAPTYIEELRQTPVQLTVCSEENASTYPPSRHPPRPKRYKIGFANLSDALPFAADVRRGLERAIQTAPDMELIARDNQMDTEVALRVADELIAAGVHLVIEYHLDEHAGPQLMDKFQRAGIPVIAVDIPMVGATFFGVDNYRAGHLAGLALGEWILRHWQGHVEQVIMLEEPRAGKLPAARMQGQLDGLQKILGPLPAERIHSINCGNNCRMSEEQIYRLLQEMPSVHRIAVLCFNDEAALGAVRAARKLGREEDLVVVGQGADRQVRQEIRNPQSRIIGSTAYWPERYGPKLIEIAGKILAGQPVPPAIFNEHVFISRDNINLYYPQDVDSAVYELPIAQEEMP